MRRCIFCQGTGKSREHVSSEWTHGIVPAEVGAFCKTKGQGEVLLATNQIRYQHTSRQDMPIDLAHLQVHGTCARCNNGWMSEIESVVKPVMTEMLEDNERAISVSEQIDIANWITLKAIVAECLDREHAVVSESERHWFYENKRPFRSSQVHIARYSGQGPGRHFTARAYAATGGNLTKTLYMGKFTLIKLGNILMTHGYVVPPMENRVIIPKSISHRLDQLYPQQRSAIDWPPPYSLDDEQVIDFVTKVRGP